MTDMFSYPLTNSYYGIFLQIQSEQFSITIIITFNIMSIFKKNYTYLLPHICELTFLSCDTLITVSGRLKTEFRKSPIRYILALLISKIQVQFILGKILEKSSVTISYSGLCWGKEKGKIKQTTSFLGCFSPFPSNCWTY